MRDISLPNQSLLKTDGHRLATCWRVARVDGGVVRFTSHPTALTVNNESYEPSDVIRSASDTDDKGESSDQEMTGLVSVQVLEADIRAGRYRGATVLVMTVDWRWCDLAGPMHTITATIDVIEWDLDQWRATLVTISERLRRSHQHRATFTRKCGWKQYGDLDCGKVITTISGTITTVNSQVNFSTNVVAATGFHDYGRFTFTTGNNIGLAFEVKEQVSGVFILQERPPFTVQVNDEFTAEDGCDRLAETCKDKNNFSNFGGFEDIVGTDRLIDVPDSSE